MSIRDGSRTQPGREGILDAAARLFLDRGYRDTTLRDIAAGAGVKAGSIYYHFASKEDMLTTILDEGIARITRAVEEALAAAEGEPFPRRLEVAVQAHLEALFEHGPYTAAHVGVFHRVPKEVQQGGLPARDAYEGIWEELLTEAVDSGEVASDLDLTAARLAMLGAMNATLDWYQPDGPLKVDAVASTFARVFLGGVR